MRHHDWQKIGTAGAETFWRCTACGEESSMWRPPLTGCRGTSVPPCPRCASSSQEAARLREALRRLLKEEYDDMDDADRPECTCVEHGEYPGHGGRTCAWCSARAALEGRSPE